MQLKTLNALIQVHTGICRATGSTGCLNGRDSGSCLYSFSSVGISAWRNSSGLKTETTQTLFQVFHHIYVFQLVQIEIPLKLPSAFITCTHKPL